MSPIKIKEKNRLFWILLWMVPLLFYVFFALADGVAWCADSNSYVAMHDCREPLYPSLLALLRFVFGIGSEADPQSNISLNAVVMIQSILAAVATSSLAGYVIREYILNGVDERITLKTGIFSSVLIAIPLMVSLLNRFAAGRSSMYSNSIMTEGLTISIYLITFRFLLEYVNSGSKRAFYMSGIMVLLGITTRKQMYVLLCLLVLSVIYVRIILPIKENNDEKKYVIVIKTMLVLIITVISIVGLALLLDCSYNMAIRGVFVPHTEDNRFVSTMVFYTAERSYSQYIDPQLQDIYLQIYDECDANGWLMHDSPKTWNESVDHFSDNYDFIQLNTMQIMLEDYVDDADYNGFKEGMTKTEKLDAVRASFNASLLGHEKGRLLKVFYNNFLCGLVNTVARRNSILCVYSVLVYMVFIILAFITRKQTVTLTCLTGLSILGNITLVSAVIFCQTRYTIYNMPIFYMTLVIMIYKFLENRIKRGTKDHV